MSEKVDPVEGYRLLEVGETKPVGYECRFVINNTWAPGSFKGSVVQTFDWPCRVKITEEPKNTNTPDPKTKYLRKAYPVDGQIHMDANGNQYILIDVYTVLQAFEVASHALGHAIKKLLCAGIRGKGDKLQDLTESKVTIDRGIQEAGRG